MRRAICFAFCDWGWGFGVEQLGFRVCDSMRAGAVSSICRERERQREREIERESERARERKIERERETETDRQTERQRQTETERERERKRKRETDRQTDRERERERERERARARARERESAASSGPGFGVSYGLSTRGLFTKSLCSPLCARWCAGISSRHFMAGNAFLWHHILPEAAKSATCVAKRLRFEQPN